MKTTQRLILCFLTAFMWLPSFADTTGIDAELQSLTHEFDAARFEIPSGEARVKALEAVRQHAAALWTRYPQRAEPLVWQAWALNEQADAVRSFSSLGLLKQARKKLEAAIAIDPNVCGADAYALLGGLYAQLPGFPISFGNEKTGRDLLLKALTINPTGIHPNMGYARYLFKIDDSAGAVKYATAALHAPPRPGRDKADAHLHAQAEELIEKSKAKLR
jgi:tetratricopeptide (TPR) repeat protein